MRLYALLDMQTLRKKGLQIEDFLDICKRLKAVMLQYRDKTGTFQEKRDNLAKIKRLSDIKLIVNDDIELVPYCDGLHIGQEDLEVLLGREKISNKEDFFRFFKSRYDGKIIGLSTHNEKEIKEANGFEIDYIGLGAYRCSGTKEVSNILGEKLSVLAANSSHPVAAIGGVRIDDKIDNVAYLTIGNGLYEN